jgi:hypothetical protein
MIPVPGLRPASGDQHGARTRILVPAPEQAALIAAARDSAPVSGLTHNFYRYPARFSPRFVRAAIEIFSALGDVVLDPFMGGGTTLVEALALGRHSIGVDISSLAAFVANVKTTLLTDEEFEGLDRWAEWAPTEIHMQRCAVHFGDYAEAGYYRHLTSPATWTAPPVGSGNPKVWQPTPHKLLTAACKLSFCSHEQSVAA